MIIEELGLSEEQIEAVKKYGQSEADKVRTEYVQKLKAANEELLKYKPAEKSESEKAIEEKLNELAIREKELLNKEKAMTISEKLKAKGIPVELAQYLTVGDDIEEDINNLSTVLGNYYLEGSNRPTNHRTNKGITKEDFKKMSYVERTKLFQENNELYKILSK